MTLWDIGIRRGIIWNAMVTLCRQSPWPAQVVYNMGNTVSWIIGSNCEMNSTPVAPPSCTEALVLFLGLWSTNLAGTLHIGRNWFGPLDELFQNDVTTLKFTPCSVERSCRFWLLTETTKKNNKLNVFRKACGNTFLKFKSCLGFIRILI